MSQFLRLYKSILRLHTSLPSIDLRIIGDEYVKKEFRDHLKSADPDQMAKFMKEWLMYSDTLRFQLLHKDLEKIGRDLDTSTQLSDEQRLDIDRLHKTLNVNGQ